jgi:hypothetical protein
MNTEGALYNKEGDYHGQAKTSYVSNKYQNQSRYLHFIKKKNINFHMLINLPCSSCSREGLPKNTEHKTEMSTLIKIVIHVGILEVSDADVCQTSNTSLVDATYYFEHVV